MVLKGRDLVFMLVLFLVKVACCSHVFASPADEITTSFRRFGHLVVDWPHKAESKSYFPPKGTDCSTSERVFP